MKRFESGTAPLPFGEEELRQHILEAKLRLALLQHQRQQDEATQTARDALPTSSLKALEEARFFARTEGRTLRFIKRHERRSLKPAQPAGLRRVVLAFASLLLVLTLGFGTALAVSPALRVQVMRLLYTVTPQYTEVRFEADPDSSFEVPARWEGLYFPAYVPEGYIFSESASTRTMKLSAFVKDDDHFFRFNEYDLKVEGNVNTEGMETREIEVHGMPGLLATKDGYTQLVWSTADKYFAIDITEDAETAIKIADSVLRVK